MEYNYEDYKNSTFLNEVRQNIVTGDLNIIENVHLRYLLKVGSKFRINNKLNPIKSFNTFTAD